MANLLLEGNVDQDHGEIEFLRSEVERLEGELRESRMDALKAKSDAERAVRGIRKALAPFYQSLRALFGEMDAIAPEDTGTQSATDPRWESWKKRMPGKPAEFIDLLLIHGSMSVKQFMAAAHCGKDAVYATVSKLGQAGVTINNGGRYSLRP